MNEGFKIMRRTQEDGMLFYMTSPEFDEPIPLLSINHNVYRNHTKFIGDFIQELSVEIIKRAEGEDVRLDITRGSELN